MDKLVKQGEQSRDINKIINKPQGLTLDAAKLLYNMKVKMVGSDTISIGSFRYGTGVIAHYFCTKDIPLIGQLINLNKVNIKKNLWFEAFPLPIEGVEATPCRAIVREF